MQSLRFLVLPLAVVAAAGCAQMKYQRAQRYAQAHPAMEECWMNTGPKGAALVDCLEKPLVTDARECFKEQIGQLSPDEKHDLEKCMLQARESDRELLSAMAIRSAGAPRLYSMPRYYVTAPTVASPPSMPTHTSCTSIGFSVDCNSY